MKKKLMVILAVLSAGSIILAGCGKGMTVTVNIKDNSQNQEDFASEDDVSGGLAGMDNPISVIADDADYENVLGFSWDTSFLPGTVVKSIISGSIGQAEYEVKNVNDDSVRVTLRGSKDDSLMENPVELLAGMYFDDIETVNAVEIDGNDGEITVNRMRSDSQNIEIALFDYDKVHYSVTTEGELSQMELSEIIDNVMAVIGAVSISVPESEGKYIKPLEEKIDFDNMAGKYACNIEAVNEKDGEVVGRFGIYTMDLYDAVDITNLQPGDTILVGAGEKTEILVEKVTKADPVTLTSSDESEDETEARAVIDVNGGIDEGGASFIAYEGGTFRYFGFDDHATYTLAGTAELPVAMDASIIDHAFDYDNPDDEVGGKVIEAADFAKYFEDELDEFGGTSYFYFNNTSITIEDGQVVDITRIFIP